MPGLDTYRYKEWPKVINQGLDPLLDGEGVVEVEEDEAEVLHGLRLLLNPGVKVKKNFLCRQGQTL